MFMFKKADVFCKLYYGQKSSLVGKNKKLFIISILSLMRQKHPSKLMKRGAKKNLCIYGAFL